MRIFAKIPKNPKAPKWYMSAPALPNVAASVTLTEVMRILYLRNFFKKFSKTGLKTIIPKVAPNESPKLAS